MKTTVKILLAVTIVLSTIYVKAQEKRDTGKVSRTFQFTFITPLGTNGIESENVTNNLSINLLAGYNGGLRGTEFGGFANILKGDMDGAQFAGFSNINLKTGKGFHRNITSNFLTNFC